DSATGYAAVQEARLQGARDAVFVDAHNCLEPGVGLTLFGSHRSHEIIEAAKSATQAALAAPKAPFRVGYANRKGFSTPDQGIGARGIEALVVETGGQRTAYVLFDGNNMVPGVRDEIRAKLASLVQESEAMTTDNHSVNLTMDGFNAVGAVLSRDVILAHAEGAVREAISGLEEAEAAAFVADIPDFRIFGPQSAARLTTTINSTLAVLRPALYVTLSGAVAVEGHVHEAEQPRLRLVRLDTRVLREEDAARAGSHDRHGLVRRTPDDLVEEAKLDEELGDRRALAAGDRQRIDTVQVLAPSYVD